MKTLLIFCIFLCGSVAACAQCIPPQYQTGTTSFGANHLYIGGSMVGQSFVPECTSYLTSITASVGRVVNGAPDIFRVSVYQGNGLNPEMLLATQSIADSLIFAYTTLSVDQDVPYSTIQFETPVLLEAGQAYSFWFEREVVGATDFLRVAASSSNVYPEGVYMSFDTTLNTILFSVGGHDLAFEIHTACYLFGDFDLDGVVDTEDFLTLLAVFGTEIDLPALGDSGMVDIERVLMFLAVFGTECQ